MSGPADKAGGQDPPPPSSASSQTKSSREASPPRPVRSASAVPQLSRSRKSSQEFSPTRNNALSATLTTIPSAAAVQRALSAQRPVPPPGNSDATDATRSDRVIESGHSSPAWPTSPRLKSPPPTTSSNRNQQSKKNESEQTPSNTSLKRLATVAGPDTAAAMQIPEPGKEQTIQQSAGRPNGRGASAQTSNLETVAESSVPTTPSIGPVRSPGADSKIDASFLDKSETTSQSSMAKDADGSGDGESKSATTKAEKTESAKKAPSSSGVRPAAGATLAKRSLTSLTTSKPKPPDPPRTMTVETEPVTSMPQLLGSDRGISGRDGNGTVRTKPSSETIRPKKDKKKSTRKIPSLHAGTATSKADLFEAKVASAVDEADTSDSDETFVYESNPPDPRAHHHSRTPSATSLVGQEHLGRSRHGIRSGSHAIGGKKSMKFSNSAYNNHLDEDGAGGRGSTRDASTPRPHHIGRHGKNAHASILDTSSLFTQANRASSPRNTNGYFARNSRPDSPRLSNGRLLPSPKKSDPFDIYDDAADDERTPLMGSVRVNRSRHSRRPNGSSLRDAGYYEDADRSYCGRSGGCILLGLVVLVICVGVATFVVALNQPLLDVKIRHLQNILASEQELMLDLQVDAVNTNIFAITVTDLDVNLFAESAYAGTAEEWRSKSKSNHLRWANRRSTDDVEADWSPFHSPPVHRHDGVDEGTDPIDDPEPGMQKMLLGRILDFDSPLVFEASPIRRSRSSSVGEIRLAKPGNQTEVGGSERWERVLQHDFDLMVRGVIRYQLPLSSKSRSAQISSRAKVEPDSDGDDAKKPKS